MLQHVDLKINQDWSKIKEYYNKLISEMRNGKFDKFADIYEDTINGKVIIYGLGSYGSIINTDYLSKDWNVWNGPILENMLPWKKDAKEIFKNLNLHSFKFGSTDSSVKKHVDGPIRDYPICNLTYIISSADPNARTISYNKDDETVTKVAPSIVGTAFLLDIDQPHEIISEGHREVFQFCFYNKFDDIIKELDRIGPIRLGFDQ
jgi:hypothetical protein